MLADLHDRDYPEFGVDLAALFADGGVGASAVKGWLKGAIKTKGPYVWRTKPSLNDVKNGVMDVSTWMRQTRNGLRHLEPGQPGHHWAIPQNGWGKIVPNSIKNQPWNIKAMPDKVVHGRIHGKYTHEGKELPRFNMLERLHYGVPDWPKLLAGSYLSRTMDQLLHHLPVSKSGSQTNAGRTTAPTPAPPIVAAPRR